MRTTLTLDDDVLLAVKERARREHRTAGQVISELARQALNAPPAPTSEEEGDSFYGFRPLPRRPGVTITNAFINELRDQDPDG